MKDLTHDFGEKSEIFLFVFNKISLEIMSHDHLVRKQALLDYKKWILHSSNIWIFFRRINPCVWSKNENLSLFVFGQNRPGNSVLRIFEVEKQALLDCKNMIFHRRHIGFLQRG